MTSLQRTGILRLLPVRGSEMLEGFSERFYPPLKGYIETELKRGRS